MSTLETYVFGWYGVGPYGKARRTLLLCSDCAEIRAATGNSVRFLDPVAEEDPHTDCHDCGTEAVFGQELKL